MAKITDKEIQEHISNLKENIVKHENRIKNSVEALVNSKIELRKYNKKV